MNKNIFRVTCRFILETIGGIGKLQDIFMYFLRFIVHSQQGHNDTSKDLWDLSCICLLCVLYSLSIPSLFWYYWSFNAPSVSVQHWSMSSCDSINNVPRCSVLALKVRQPPLAHFAGICRTDALLAIHCSLLLWIPDWMVIEAILRLHCCSTRSAL